MDEYQKQYNFEVNREDIPTTKILKNNFIPKEDYIEVFQGP